MCVCVCIGSGLKLRTAALSMKSFFDIVGHEHEVEIQSQLQLADRGRAGLQREKQDLHSALPCSETQHGQLSAQSFHSTDFIHLSANDKA